MSTGRSQWKLQAPEFWLAVASHIDYQSNILKRIKKLSPWAIVPNSNFFWFFFTENKQILFIAPFMFCENQTMFDQIWHLAYITILMKIDLLAWPKQIAVSKFLSQFKISEVWRWLCLSFGMTEPSFWGDAENRFWRNLRKESGKK